METYEYTVPCDSPPKNIRECFVCCESDPPPMKSMCACKNAHVHRDCFIRLICDVKSHSNGTCPMCKTKYQNVHILKVKYFNIQWFVVKFLSTCLNVIYFVSLFCMSMHTIQTLSYGFCINNIKCQNYFSYNVFSSVFYASIALFVSWLLQRLTRATRRVANYIDTTQVHILNLD
jgi:hypothetical protein